MKTFVWLFVVSAVFGATIGIVYFLVAHAEATGTTLLGVMTAALVFTAGYAILAERNANLDGDSDNANAAATGEDLGVFSSGSIWPPLVALAVLCILCGVLFGAFLAVMGAMLLVYCLWRLGSESARI